MSEQGPLPLPGRDVTAAALARCRTLPAEIAVARGHTALVAAKEAANRGHRAGDWELDLNMLEVGPNLRLRTVGTSRLSLQTLELSDFTPVRYSKVHQRRV